MFEGDTGGCFTLGPEEDEGDTADGGEDGSAEQGAYGEEDQGGPAEFFRVDGVEQGDGEQGGGEGESEDSGGPFRAGVPEDTETDCAVAESEAEEDDPFGDAPGEDIAEGFFFVDDGDTGEAEGDSDSGSGAEAEDLGGGFPGAFEVV
ncbi:MAG: hypothetical protein RI897_1390 [Verrucomicrobiota bacterium]